MPKVDESKIAAVWVRRDSLVPWNKNPRKNNAAAQKVAESISKIGWGAPIVARSSTRQVIAGHTRLKAAELLNLEEVPVRFIDVDEKQAEIMAIADNKLNELAEWDYTQLKDIFSNISVEELSVLGFSSKEVKYIENFEIRVEPTYADPKIESAKQLRAFYGVETGQRWRLGEHTIICGNSHDYYNVSESCETILYDPPWDQIELSDCRYKERPGVLAFCDGSRAGDIITIFGAPSWVFNWDCVSCWYTPNRPLKRVKMCFWYGDLKIYNFEGSHYGAAGIEKYVVNSRGRYKYRPNPRGKHLSDLFCSPITKLHSNGLHSHEKPIDWVRMLIGNCTRGDVFDPYLGSGSTLVACEQLGRKCVGIEINPDYVAVVLQRFADMTRTIPVLILQERK